MAYLSIDGAHNYPTCSSPMIVCCFAKQPQGNVKNSIERRQRCFFSRNTLLDTQECIKQLFGTEVIKQHEKYLGLPSLVARSKKNTFQQLKEWLANKLSGWKEKLLSNAGKEVLIKAVAQAIPAHTMSCFLLPTSVAYVMKWQAWCVTFDGDKKGRKEKLHGWNGIRSVNQKQMKVWDLGT